MITTYLNSLKTKGNFTVENISNLSGIPEATVKNIFPAKPKTPDLKRSPQSLRQWEGHWMPSMKW